MPSWCHMEGWLLNKDLPAKEQQSAEATINNAGFSNIKSSHHP